MARTKNDPIDAGLKRWAVDPVAFIRDVFGETPWSVQRQILQATLEHRKVAVAGCHGLGKSWIASRAVCHRFATVERIVIPTTAPTWRQVNDVLWREIRKAATKAKRRGMQISTRLPQRQPRWVDTDDHLAFGFASNRPENLQGYHEANLFMPIDEACGIPDDLWPAVLSLMSNDNSSCLAIGNPDTASSEFARIFGGAPGNGWHCIHVSAFDTPNFTGEQVSPVVAASLVSREYELDVRRQFGEDSNVYRSKILGQFPKSGTDVVIPWGWILRAQEREPDRSGPVVWSLDVARHGGDRSSLWLIRGNAPEQLGSWQLDDLEILAQHVNRTLQDAGVVQWTPGVVDADGIGAGTYDRLRSLGWSAAMEFHGAGAVPDYYRPADGVALANQRAVAWWELRTDIGSYLWMPGEDAALTLLDDCRDISYKYKTIGGRTVILIESKDDIRGRRGKSPDDGDALMMANWCRRRAHELTQVPEFAFGGGVQRVGF